MGLGVGAYDLLLMTGDDSMIINMYIVDARRKCCRFDSRSIKHSVN